MVVDYKTYCVLSNNLTKIPKYKFHYSEVCSSLLKLVGERGCTIIVLEEFYLLYLCTSIKFGELRIVLFLPHKCALKIRSLELIFLDRRWNFSTLPGKSPDKMVKDTVLFYAVIFIQIWYAGFENRRSLFTCLTSTNLIKYMTTKPFWRNWNNSISRHFEFCV